VSVALHCEHLGDPLSFLRLVLPQPVALLGHPRTVTARRFFNPQHDSRLCRHVCQSSPQRLEAPLVHEVCRALSVSRCPGTPAERYTSFRFLNSQCNSSFFSLFRCDHLDLELDAVVLYQRAAVPGGPNGLNFAQAMIINDILMAINHTKVVATISLLCMRSVRGKPIWLSRDSSRLLQMHFKINSGL